MLLGPFVKQQSTRHMDDWLLIVQSLSRLQNIKIIVCYRLTILGSTQMGK